jgi:hypothetical protein
MDLVKNLLFSEARESEFQSIKETWKEITANLQRCNEENKPLRFLRYFLMARYYDGIIREDDLYKWIISPQGKAATQYETQPMVLATELKKLSRRYADLVRATELLKDGSDFPSITNIGYVNKYKSRQHLILLMALPVGVEKEILNYLGQQIEAFFFFSNTVGIQAKYNEGLFAGWAGKLRHAKNLEEVKQVVAQNMVPYLQSKLSEFKSAFANISHRSYNPLYRLRYVLGRLENTIREKSGLPVKGHDYLDGLQIEHIFPQTPKNGFLPEGFLELDQYKEYVYKLGNVTLVESTINQAVNNFNDLERQEWFATKQTEYGRSDIATTNLLDHNYRIGNDTGLNRFRKESGYHFETWSLETVNQRQKVLLDLAFETWKLNGQRLDNYSTILSAG